MTVPAVLTGLMSKPLVTTKAACLSVLCSNRLVSCWTIRIQHSTALLLLLLLLW